jgi:capsid protein
MGVIRRVLGWLGLGQMASMGYRAVRVAFRDGRAPNHGSGDAHERQDRLHLYGMSREYYRDRSTYRGPIDRFADCIIGSGFKPQARTSDPEWNARAERILADAWKNLEVTGLSGREAELTLARELLLMGDVGAVKTQDGRIQIVEAERICGPNYSDDGIKRDASGAPVSYRVAPYSKAGQPEYQRAVEIAAENFIHILRKERPSSSRGIPVGQSSFTILHFISELCDSEVQSALVQSRLAVSITRTGGPGLGYNDSTPDTTKTAEDGDVTSRVQIFDGVTIFHGEPGDEIKGVERSAPGAQFSENIRTFFRLLGLAFGLPLEFMFLDWTQTNYSQSRAIIEQASIAIMRWQTLLEEVFHRPMYEWIISRAMAQPESGLAFNEEWDRHEWIKPASPWIDLEKEASANGVMLDRGLTTHSQVLKSRNQDRDDVIAQQAKEIEDAIAEAKKIEAKYPGVKVPWEPFMGRTPAVQPQAAPAPTKGVGEPRKAETEEEPAKKKNDEDAAASPADLDAMFSSCLGEINGPIFSAELIAELQAMRKNK